MAKRHPVNPAVIVALRRWTCVRCRHIGAELRSKQGSVRYVRCPQCRHTDKIVIHEEVAV